MKLIIVIMTALMVQVSAAGFAQKITFVKKNASLEQIFNEIRKQTGYDVLWLGKDLDIAQKINADFRQADLNEVMQKSLADLKLSYTIEDKNIVIKKMPPSFLDRLASVIVNDDGKFADIRGVVRNERGEPLEGITVIVKGAKTGTRTNAQGKFVLKGVKKGDVLVFTGVAIETFEYTVKDDKNIDLNLKARLVQLEEVGINTGYQKISKERYVGSYSQLDNAAFHRRAGMGILERLDGTVTGVLFNKKTTSSPYPNQIQIRGISTIESDSRPLIIVDNFPYAFDLSTINPNDVENVTVLKDAAAASIWGARAGNGVIVVTTKKAKFNQPLTVSWNSNVNIQSKPDLYHYPQISSSEFIDLEQFLFSKGAYDIKLNDLQMPAVSPVVDILNKIKNGGIAETEGKILIDNFRNIDLRGQLDRFIYQKGITQQHYLNLNGGSANMNYQISMGYNNTRPNIQHSKNDEQYTVTSNASFNIGKKINIAAGINLSQGVQRSAKLPSLPSYAYGQLADDNGNSLAVPNMYRLSYIDTVGSGALLDWHFRPLDEIKSIDETNIGKAATFNTSLSYAAKPWLSFNFIGQYNLQNSEGRGIKSLETYETRNLINRFTNLRFSDPSLRNPVPIGGILDLNYGKSNGYNLRGNVTINKSWSEHQLNLMIAGDVSDNKSNSNRSRFFGYQPEYGGVNPLIDYVNYYVNNFGFNSRIPNSNFLGDQMSGRFVSITGNASYSYGNKYTAYASARRDGSNVFGVNTNNKWKPLWSLGMAWQINREKFFNFSWIDNLSIRSTFGYSGNVNNNLNGVPVILYSTTPDVNTGLRYASTVNPPNPDLRWEEVRTFNIGSDFSVLKNRLSGSFQYFNKVASDLISPMPFAASTGVLAYTVNSASLRGNGFELNLAAKILDNNLRWTMSYGLSYAKTIVTKINEPNNFAAQDFISFNINPAVGRLAYGLSSYRWSGLDPQTGDPRGVLNGEISKDYISIMRDSVDNQVFHGSAIPLYSGFLSNAITWKNVSLSFNINYKLNFYLRRPALNYVGIETRANIFADYNLRWKNPGDEKITNVPSLIYPGNDPNRDIFYSFSEVNVLRGDHIRLQDIKLQYIVKTGNGQYAFLKGLSAFVYLNNINVILWRRNRSKLDPDFAGGTELSSPSPRTLTLGLTANF